FWLEDDLEPWEFNVFITRLHVRYTRDKFPEDLTFQETNNRRLFQGRYVMHHTFANANEQACIARQMDSYGGTLSDGEIEYLRQLNQNYVVHTVPERFERESKNLARLTGRDLSTIRRRISAEVPQPQPSIWQLRYPPQLP
ncbi:MAG: hypothetical protein AAGA01_16520, partial [Cyanobacteria bacterium P01_E01_bin.43]